MGCRKKLKELPWWADMLLALLIVGIVVTAIVLPIVLIAPSASGDDRIECFPFKSLAKDSCTDAGCLWDDSIQGAPSCFLPDSSQYGYEVNGAVVNLPSNKGFRVDLRRHRLSDGSLPKSLYGGDVDEVVFEVNYHNDHSMGFTFYAKGSNVTSARPPVPITPASDPITGNQLYQVDLVSSVKGQPFNFQIRRKSSKTLIFDTSMGGLTIAEQFLMISTKLPTRYLYGFGENTHDTFLHDMQYRMWPIFTRDIAPSFEDVNLYGAHPFYMASESDGSSHGVFFYNSHAIDVTTMPQPGITFRTIGGLLDFFVFLGPEPEAVVQQYTGLVGRTYMPPYFALGFQICRWGYKNTDDIRKVIERTKAVGIPQDVQYADIDYMDGRRDFTIDPVNFADLPQLVDEVKKDGLRFIVMFDPAIASDYATYDRGLADNVFVEWANKTIKPPGQPTDSDVVLGNVWPDNRTAFPDFFKTSAQKWWTNEIRLFYDRIKFDALWIDMNEVSNFDTNVWDDKLNCPENKWDDPPYETMAAHIGPSYRLSDKTICMASKFGDSGEHLHYDVHNLYGYSHAVATRKAVKEIFPEKRTMILSRSTFSGSGPFTSHWLGDNFSRWSAMADSIIGMMEFNMFGMPYVGADICGFILNTTEEMCERWMEVGAFYPFARSHNVWDAMDQDPGLWPNTVGASGRKAFNIRYRLLPYLYTLLHDSHVTGSTVVRPLYHEYPKDLKARSIDRQFLWGAAFMISPVLEEGKTTVDVYFPDDVWYDYYTGAKVAKVGTTTTLDAPRDVINLHIRGGHILPAQKPALNTMLSRQNNFELLVALDANMKAKGKMFWDDGEKTDSFEDGFYQINTFEFSQNTLSIEVAQGSSWIGIDQELDLIQILGWSSSPTSISANGTPLPSTTYNYNTTNQLLSINYALDMNTNWVLVIQ